MTFIEKWKPFFSDFGNRLSKIFYFWTPVMYSIIKSFLKESIFSYKEVVT